MKKDENLHIRIGRKLKEKIKSQSKKANISISKYVERILENKNIVVIEDGSKIYFELNKIGNNLNQIAKKVNSGIATSNDLKNLSDISRSLKEIWQLLNLLMSK